MEKWGVGESLPRRRPRKRFLQCRLRCGMLNWHTVKSSNTRYCSLGCQGLTHSPRGERYPFQPTVPSAITLQLPQTTTQSHTELPATRLGDEDSSKRPALLH